MLARDDVKRRVAQAAVRSEMKELSANEAEDQG